MNRASLLDTIQAEYAHFEELIRLLSETQLCTPPSEGEWSVKDNMAHIAIWEQICAHWLEQVVHDVTPQPSERLDAGINDRIYRENRDRSLAEVQELFRHAHQQFLSQIDQLFQTLSEEDITTPHRFAWTDAWSGSSILAVIADNSYEHYHDHAQQIRHWLNASQSDIHNK